QGKRQENARSTNTFLSILLCASVPLRLCVYFVGYDPSPAAEPSPWKLWPFRSTQKSAPAATSQLVPVQIAPASFQSPLPGSAPGNIDPFPLPPGFASANNLYRQTEDDVLRKSWGCVN